VLGFAKRDLTTSARENAPHYYIVSLTETSLAH